MSEVAAVVCMSPERVLAVVDELRALSRDEMIARAREYGAGDEAIAQAAGEPDPAAFLAAAVAVEILYAGEEPALPVWQLDVTPLDAARMASEDEATAINAANEEKTREADAQ